MPPLTKRQRGWILAAVATLLVLSFALWRVLSHASLDRAVRHVSANARSEYGRFDVRSSHLEYAAAQLQHDPSAVTTNLPELDGARIYQAEYTADGTQVRVIYWIDRGWAGRRCVFVTATVNDAPTVEDGDCPTASGP